MSQEKNPTLTYFDIRGRTEPIRLLLHDNDIEFEDKRILLEDWSALKPKITPFHTLPIFEDGDLKITQSSAILRYLAKKHGDY